MVDWRVIGILTAKNSKCFATQSVVWNNLYQKRVLCARQFGIQELTAAVHVW